MSEEKLLNLAHFSDLGDETMLETTEEEATPEEETAEESVETPEPEVVEETQEEPKYTLSNIQLNDSVLVELEEKVKYSFVDEALTTFGVKTLEELEEVGGDVGIQVAGIVRKAEENNKILEKAINEIKSVRENPTVKEILAGQEVISEIQANYQDWQADFQEDNPDLMSRLSKVNKKDAEVLAPQIDKLIFDYVTSKKAAGKKLSNPLLALQGKIEKLIEGVGKKPSEKKEEPKQTKQVDLNTQKKLASLKTSGEPPAPTKVDPRIAKLPKSRAEGLISMSHLADSMKIDE